MKKILTIILALVMTFLSMSALSSCGGEENPDDQTPEYTSEPEYKISPDGDYYILSGFGIYDGNSIIVPAEYNGKPVRVVEANAFNETYVWDLLKSITLPGSVQLIENGAFKGCKNLSEVTLAKGLLYIEKEAFYNCTSLKSITLPEGLSSIGESAFFGCASIENIIIPDSVTIIGENAFLGTKFLSSNAPSIEDIRYARTTGGAAWVLKGSRDTVHANLPDNAIGIASSAFENSKNLTTVEIPAGVAYICSNAFKNTSKLETVYYGGSAEDFAKIIIGGGNDYFKNATVVYAK